MYSYTVHKTKVERISDIIQSHSRSWSRVPRGKMHYVHC